MLQCIEVYDFLLSLFAHSYFFHVEYTEGNAPAGAGNLTNIFFFFCRHCKRPDSIHYGPVFKQHSAGYCVISNVRVRLVDSNSFNVYRRLEKIIHQIQLVRREIMKISASADLRIKPPVFSRRRHSMLIQRESY